MDLFSVAVGVCVGVALAVLTPKAWAKMVAGGRWVHDKLTTPPEDRDRP